VIDVNKIRGKSGYVFALKSATLKEKFCLLKKKL